MSSSALRSSPPRPGPAPRRRSHRVLTTLGIALAIVLALVAAVGFLPNETIRRSIETRMNASLKGYSARIGRARFQPIGFALTLENVVVRQQAHPEPAILEIPLLRASVHWKELIALKVVADFLFDRARIYANLTQLREEADDPTPVRRKGWQQAFESIYPLKINLLRVRDASVTYIDADPQKPLVLTHLDARATNIRNIHSRKRTYPSPFEARAVVFGKGRAELDGHADFLAEPYAGVQGRFRLVSIPLDAFEPVLSRFHVKVAGGTFTGDGEVEYAPAVRVLKVPNITIDRVKLGYVRSRPASVPAKKPEAAALSDASVPSWDLSLDRFRLSNSQLELEDPTHQPAYRLFVTGVSADVTGLANSPPGRTAHAAVRGKFMNDGEATADATFRAGRGKTLDLDLRLHVAPTSLSLLNDLFRAHGKFDVYAGTLEVFSEIGVHKAYMSGYVKPIFKDVEVYDKRQEAQKGFLKKVYEGAVDAAAQLLKNRKHDQVATDISVAGPVGNAKSSLLDTLGGLLENAFIRAILPGFDRQVGTLKGP